MKKPQTDRAKRRRAMRYRNPYTGEEYPRCPEHGNEMHKGTKYGHAHRYTCGCLTGTVRN